MTKHLDFACQELTFLNDNIAQLVKTGKWPKALLDKLDGYPTDEELMEDFMESLFTGMDHQKKKSQKKKIRNTRSPKTKIKLKP